MAAAMKSFSLTILTLFSCTQLTVGESHDALQLIKEIISTATETPPPGRGQEAPGCLDCVEDHELKADGLLQMKKVIHESEITKLAREERVVMEDIDGTAMKRARLGRRRSLAAVSCGEIRDMDPSSGSRHYWLRGEEELNPGKIFCDYEFEPPSNLSTVVFNVGSGEGGWMRLVDWNMHNRHSRCPQGLMQDDSPRKGCGNGRGHRCSSLTFSTHGVPYQRVCGMVSGYLRNTSDSPLHRDCPSCHGNIDEAYLKGLSITYGSPRTHIWSYVADWTRAGSSHQSRRPCPSASNLQPPDFVGRDHYCELGGQRQPRNSKDCGEVESSHGRCPGMPWFCRELSGPTTEDIELRVCLDPARDSEKVFVDVVKLFVQ